MSTWSIPAPSTDISDAVRQICDYLDSEGFKGEIDDDGDVVFRCEGLAYLLCLDSAQERMDVMQAVDFVNCRSKLVTLDLQKLAQIQVGKYDTSPATTH